MKSNKMKTPFYLQTWFISLLFAFWFFIVPIFPGIYLLIKRYAFDKELRAEYEKIDDISAYKKQVDDWYANQVKELGIAKKSHDDVVLSWEQDKTKREEYNQKLEDTKSELKQEVKQLKQEIKRLKTDIDIETVTFSTVDESITSEEYKSKYNLLVLEEKEIIKDNNSIEILDETIAKKIISNDIKQLQRCFNSETDTLIRSLTIKNIETVKGRIIKSYEALNKLFATDGIRLSKQLLEIKLKETDLMFSYEYQKEQEKLQQKAIREQMIEEEKVRREIEKEKEKIEKEENHFHKEINKLMDRLRLASEIEKQLYIDKINELNAKLKEVEESKKNVLERESNTRAGYVYIISNIGSFGENVYKIGMTRRLDPLDRINELGSASVPFEFDVHAMIFTDDAPALETTLHNTFKDKRVNMVNTRKEFFRVSLDEIVAVVKQNFNATVEFTMTAKAEQFRETQKILSNTQLITTN